MIVAGGTGTRMNTGIPKQFLLLENRPVLMHTIEVFRKYDLNIRIIVVLPENQTDTWKGLCDHHNFEVGHELGYGGDTRFHSVKKNLFLVPDDCLIGIHDGVRPLVSLETIERCYSGALKFGNAIPCIRIPETLRRVDETTSVQVDRDLYRLIQTPQVFKANILKRAYEQNYQEEFTDDAGVIENAGYSIHLVNGNSENIKITYKNDLKTAAALIGS